MNIGIIYCPTHRLLRNPRKRLKKICASLDKYEVKYDLIESEERQSVTRLVAMLVNQGYKTIVIAGGDSSLNDAVNYLMKLEKHVRDGITLGVIPNGMMNDFAAFWGLTYDDIDKSVRSIKQCRVRKIDIAYLIYDDKKEKSDTRYFLNCVNIGLLANIQKLRQYTRRILWSRRVSFVISLLLMMFQRLTYKITYNINEQEKTHKVTTMCIGSSLGYGQTPNATPYNGMLDITVLRSTLLMQYVEAVWLFVRGRILTHKRVEPYRCHSVNIKSEKGFPVSVDGHFLCSKVKNVCIKIEPEEINFIMEEWEK